MRFLLSSLVFLMLRIVFNVFLVMFPKTSLLFCCSCIQLFATNYVCVVPYGVTRNSCFELCSSSSGIFVKVKLGELKRVPIKNVVDIKRQDHS